MKWYFFVCNYFLLVNSMQRNNLPDVTLISEKFTSPDRYNISCVITNSTSAITWISNLTAYPTNYYNRVSQFIPAVTTQYDCDISFHDHCSVEWISNQWRIIDSYYDDLPAVTDYRWEDFTVHVTDGSGFIPIKPIVNYNTFKIHISIRTSKDAHLYLCENNDPSSALDNIIQCYWIILNDWDLGKDRRTVLRECTTEKVPKTRFQTNCSNFEYITNHTSKSYLSDDQWNHFTLEKTDNRIVLEALEDGRKLINYRYFSNDVSVTSLSIGTYNNIGYWKFHHYEYIYSQTGFFKTYLGPAIRIERKGQFCVSFFVAMCKNCNLTVEIVDSNSNKVISTTEISAKKHKTWQEEKIVMQFPQVPIVVYLVMSTSCDDCKLQYWAIDRFRTCTTDEIRVLTTVTATKLFCQIVTLPTNTVVLSDASLMNITEPRCPLGTFGKECTNCSMVLGAANPYCVNNVICRLTSEGVNSCHCLDGYHGNDCQTPCNGGFYGLHCRETCGHCLTPPCNLITGKCRANGCHKDFTGPFCKLTKYPYLLNPPRIVKVGHTYFIAEISNRTVEGVESPLSIKIQYKEVAQNTWVDTQPQLFNTTQSISVDQLKISTTYTVRFVLITADGQFYDHSEIPEVTVTTTCAFVKENEITKNIFNTSATFILNKNTRKNSCNIKGYIIINVGIVRTESPVFIITNLEPSTTYNITFGRRDSNETLIFKITTEEGVSTQVEGLKVTGQTATSISLQWYKPKSSNGIIGHYKIIYRHLKYRSCDNVTTGEAFKNVSNEQTRIKIDNLLPYSEYSFRVTAVTMEEEKFSEIEGITLETETPEISEIPRISNIISGSKYAQVALAKPDCTLVKGTVEYSLESYCSSGWCRKNKLNTIFPFSFNSLLLDNLEPYSNYSVKLTVRRRNGKILYNPGEYYKFKTIPDAPNPIKELVTYSTTSTKLYFRFGPPYPPNGELEIYEVNYCSSSTSYDCITKSFIPQACKIWENLHCITLENLTGNIRYTVEIRAKNKNVHKLSREISTIGYTGENQSDLPQNISLLWDDVNDTLHLTWNYRNIINGSVTIFYIQIFIFGTRRACLNYNYIIEEEKYNYTLDLNITLLPQECYSSKLTVHIYPYNTKYGKYGSVDVDSPPPRPVFLETPSIQSTSNYTITLNIPKPQNVSSISFLYVFAYPYTNILVESSRTNDYIKQLLKRKEHLDSIPELVAKFNLSSTTPQELIIGSNETKSSSELKGEVINPKVLIPKTSYVIQMVLINTYSNFTRYNVYIVTAETIFWELFDATNYAFFSLLLLLLLPIIFCLYNRNRKGVFSLWRRTTFTNWNKRKIRNLYLIPRSESPDYIEPIQHPEKPEIPLKPLKAKTLELQRLQNKNAPNTHASELCKPVYIKDFENCIKERILKKELERQHIVSNTTTCTTLRNSCVIQRPESAVYLEPIEHPAKPEILLKPPKSKTLELQRIQNQNAHTSELSKPIYIKDFENYVKECIFKEELDRQHMLFPRGQIKPWDYGTLPQNEFKNRYNNLIAYDHTRVVLKKINNDPYSDYINANYIDGYKFKNAYISTQAPKCATVNDFWRMIWQENVSYIVMLANVPKGKKKTTEQYWPNIKESTHYGNIGVEFVSTQVYADYHNRTFFISNEGVERKVEQLNFISWPDHGVPLYTQSLLPLLRQLINIPYGKSPIVVHCGAGVGRTGTLILSDLCLRMALRDGCIDVVKLQQRLLEQRANMIDNIDQYKLVHLILIEYLINPTTVIKRDKNMEHAILRLLKSKEHEKQLRNITERSWQDQVLRSVIPFTPNSAWRSKNRFQDIIPGGYGRVYISKYPTADEHSDYINAIEVDGFKAPGKFIVTQQPLPSTIPDFWRMVDEKEVSTIISLNKIDPSNIDSGIFFPTSKISEIQPVPYLIVKFLEKSKSEYFNVSTLIMLNQKEKKRSKRTIHFITLNYWPAKQLVPDSIESLLELWKETEKLTIEAPTVITCYNGAQASGLFVALTFVVDKIKLEQECDVCLAVRTVRLNRLQFVENVEQFTFLYKAARKYIQGFKLYENFAPIKLN